jgi:NAD(P)-dependent dehydrogenase (short-subunit alcohol dehydrogenase family)
LAGEEDGEVGDEEESDTCDVVGLAGHTQRVCRDRCVNVETTPYPRLAEAEDIAATIAFLCSPGGEMINGQSIVVDGGWTRTKYLSPRALTSDWVGGA